jgi:thymidylate synthase (FAD)
MGSDITVVNAARVSFAKQSMYTDEGLLNDADAKLIKYLAAHKHWTPFSQPQIQLRVKIPIFVARQWYKHQVGFTRNEESRRYISAEPECYVPREWRKAAENVKQGSSEEVVENLPDIYGYTAMLSELYGELLTRGVCPEQARMVLPQSMYTEFVETGSLAAYARLYSLRSSKEAQKEVRLYAEAIGKIISPLFPVSWEALTNG